MLEEKYNKISPEEGGKTSENGEQSGTQDVKVRNQEPPESPRHSDTSKQNVDDSHVNKNEMNLKHDNTPHAETNTEQTTNTQHMHVKKDTKVAAKSEIQNSVAGEELIMSHEDGAIQIGETIQAHTAQRNTRNLRLPQTEESEKQTISDQQKQLKEGIELEQKVPEESLQHQKENLVHENPEKQNANERDGQPKTETNVRQNVRNQQTTYLENRKEKVIDLHEGKDVHKQGQIDSNSLETRNSSELPLQEEINPSQEQTSLNQEKKSKSNKQQNQATVPETETQNENTQGEPLAQQSSQSKPAAQLSSQSKPGAEHSSQNINIPKEKPIPVHPDAQTKNQQQHQDMAGQPVPQTNNLHKNQPAPSQPDVQNVNQLNVHQIEKQNVKTQQEDPIGFGTEAWKDVPEHNAGGQHSPDMIRDSGDLVNQGASRQQQKETTPQQHFSEHQDQVNSGRLQMNEQQIHQSSTRDQKILHMQASEYQYTDTFQQGSNSFSGNGQFPNSGYPSPSMLGVDPRFAHMYPPHMQGHGGPHQFPSVPNFADGFGTNQYHDPRFASHAQMHQHPHQFMNPHMSQFVHQFSNEQQMSSFGHPGLPSQAVPSVEKQDNTVNPETAHINTNQEQGN